MNLRSSPALSLLDDVTVSSEENQDKKDDCKCDEDVEVDDVHSLFFVDESVFSHDWSSSRYRIARSSSTLRLQKVRLSQPQRTRCSRILSFCQGSRVFEDTCENEKGNKKRKRS